MSVTFGQSHKQIKKAPTIKLLKQKKGGASSLKPSNGGNGASTSLSHPEGDGTATPALTAGTKQAAKQEVLGPDCLSKALHQIEQLKDQKAAFEKMKMLLLAEAMNWYQLGGVLLRINEEKWFGGYDSFEEFCVNALGFRKSKAYHLIKIYKLLVESDITWQDVEELGWSKLRLICAAAVRVKLEPAEFSTCVETAKVKKLTCVELEAELKDSILGGCGAPAGSGTVTNLVFKPHENQLPTITTALDNAKKQSGTEHDTVALEYVCLDFLSPGASQPKEKAEAGSDVAIPKPGEKGFVWPSMEQHFEHLLYKHGGDPDETMKEVGPAFDVIFPNVNVSVKILEEDAD